MVPDLRHERVPPRLDRRGFALIAAGMAALMVGVENVGDGAIGLPFIAGGAGWPWSCSPSRRHLLRAANPLVDLRMLRIASFRVTAATGSMYRTVIIAIPFLLPLIFQLGFGWTAAQAGLAVIALFVGNVGIKPVTTPMMRHFRIRTALLGSIPASARVPGRDGVVDAVDAVAGAGRPAGDQRDRPVDGVLRVQQRGVRGRRARSG